MAKGKRRKDVHARKTKKKTATYIKGSGESRFAVRYLWRLKNSPGVKPLPKPLFYH